MAEVALFVTAFFSATLLPFSSEVAFVVALENDMPFLNALISASSGNILGIVMNYLFGYWLYKKTKTKLNSSEIGRKSLLFGYKYGFFILPFSWLPIVGDPITLVAGVLRLNFLIFIFIAGFLRIARYYFLASMI